MEQFIFDLNNKAHSNLKILQEVVDNLHKLKNYSSDNIIIKGLNDAINKLNKIINDNTKNSEFLKNNISSLCMNFDKLDINKINFQNNKELIYKEGKYIGQVVNGLAEGKGIAYFNNGDKYEGDCKNGKADGRGIKLWNKGDKYVGYWKNDKKEEKGIYYYKNGDIYDGDWRYGIREGKGIYYYKNGDRRMGNYFNDEPIGKHVYLCKNGDVRITHF